MKRWTICDCGSEAAELRRNPNNNGIAYQCGACNAVLSAWIPHGELPDVNALSLPLWDTTPKSPAQGGLF